MLTTPANIWDRRPGDEGFSAEGVKSRGGKVGVPSVDSAGDGVIRKGAVWFVDFPNIATNFVKGLESSEVTSALSSEPIEVALIIFGEIEVSTDKGRNIG